MSQRFHYVQRDVFPSSQSKRLPKSMNEPGFKERRDFAGAKQHCAQLNSHLIVIECDLMNRFVEGTF
jgi:hypothetical protein